jgi:hypothetical protein
MVSVGDEVELHGERTPELDRIFDQTMTAQVVGAGQ